MHPQRSRFPALASAAFVSLKAFGDLVILRTLLAGATAPVPTVVIGSHLVELSRALGDPGDTVVIDTGAEVPALFDVRRRGLSSALASAMRLRTALARAPIGADATLVFDRIGRRERFIAGRRATAALPAAANIYMAYRATGMFDDRASPSRSRPERSQARSVGIFPASRIARKDVPRALVADVVAAAARADLRPVLYLLEGERPDLAGLRGSIERVPRTFAALAAAVRSVDLVVSADSLPAHLAEHFGVPVFVLTPIENNYWLPLTAHENDRWARFDEGAACARLHHFLARGRDGSAG